MPVRSGRRGALPGVVHDVSSSGQTVYVEPLDSLEVIVSEHETLHPDAPPGALRHHFVPDVPRELPLRDPKQPCTPWRSDISEPPARHQSSCEGLSRQVGSGLPAASPSNEVAQHVIDVALVELGKRVGAGRREKLGIRRFRQHTSCMPQPVRIVTHRRAQRAFGRSSLQSMPQLAQLG